MTLLFVDMRVEAQLRGQQCCDAVKWEDEHDASCNCVLRMTCERGGRDAIVRLNPVLYERPTEHLDFASVR